MLYQLKNNLLNIEVNKNIDKYQKANKNMMASFKN